jgi:hypothetical protein
MRTKIGFLGLLVAALLVGSVVSSDAVRADATAPVVPTVPAKKHHHHHHIHGKIVSVDATSITIKVHHHHKKGTAPVAAATEDKTFKITDKTKVEIVSETGKKPGSLSELKVGEHVSIGEHEGVAHEITIGHLRHHKKKTPVA